jgi:hypothetical protein
MLLKKNKIQKNKKNKKYIYIVKQKGLKWKGRKQWTKVNLSCLLDQVIRKKDKILVNLGCLLDQVIRKKDKIFHL